MAGTQPAPPSAMRIFRSGWRSRAPPATRCDTTRMPGIGRLHVVDDRAARARGRRRCPRRCRCGSRARRRPARRRPTAAPTRSSAYSSPGRVWLGRNTAWKPSSGGALQLGDGVVDVGQWRRTAVGMTRLFLLRISSCAQSFQARTVSRASSRSVILTVQKPIDGKASWHPDALLVEVLQPDVEVPGARRAHRVHEVVELAVDPLAVDVERSRTSRRARCAAPARPAGADSRAGHRSAGSSTCESAELAQIFSRSIVPVDSSVICVMVEGPFGRTSPRAHI